MDILDETNDMYDRREGQRPVFITVLCILTWAGSFMGLISGLFQLTAYSAVQKISQATTNLPGGTQNFGYMFWVAIGTIVGCILCSLGAFFMFRLKKTGFFIYIVGQVIPLIGSFYSILKVTSGVPMFKSLGLIGGIVGMMFPIAFIIMYGVNLKHMKK